jgi:tRNA threonylcarbamoyl adenosine modification protein (Sua5/YciO/YrdC/YwlC family)
MSTKLDNLMNCSEYLKNGSIVAFPTETVYGLGGNAFNEDAIKKIYLVKERPTTDPLIIHVDSVTRLSEWNLVDLNKLEFEIIKKFADKFWPGPLTIILKSSSNVPDLVTAGSGFIGIRIPNNKLALSLIKNSNLPIAAPSANKFGHISPTLISHVEKNFKNQNIINEPVYILENNVKCEIGIESTIIKFNNNFSEIDILRLGYFTAENFREIFKGKINYKPEYKNFNETLKSPGQFIKHYATNCDTYYVTINNDDQILKLESSNEYAILNIGDEIFNIKNKFGYYDNLSENNDVDEAFKNYYKMLYKFELKNSGQFTKLFIIVKSNIKDIKYNSLIDRIYRSSSGKKIDLV